MDVNLEREWNLFQKTFIKTHYTSCGYSGTDADERRFAFDEQSPKEEEEEPAVANEKDEDDDGAVDEDEYPQFNMIPSINTKTQSGNLQLSTKSNVLKLNTDTVPYMELFWKTPVMPYMLAKEGIVRKEIMIALPTPERAEEYFQRRNRYLHNYKDQIVSERILPLNRGSSSINNQATTILFSNDAESTHIPYRGPQDTRSLHVGICQKEIECKKREERKAFPNCFVFYLRWSRNGGKTFEESHIKIFSTGKIDMPGINCPRQLHHIKELIQKLVFPLPMLEAIHLIDSPLRDSNTFWQTFDDAKVVLVNAEFQCNFRIQLQKLRDLLFTNYKLKSELKNETPGLKCSLFVRRNLSLNNVQQTFIVDPEDEFAAKRSLSVKTKYFKITYTFFQSGEVLVSGACPEEIIEFTFAFMKNVLLINWKSILAVHPRSQTKKSKKLQYVSKCKFSISFPYLLHTVLDRKVDWRL